MIDEGRLNQLIGQMVSDLGGPSSVAMVRIGDALGLYKTLHANGAMTAAELGSAAGAPMSGKCSRGRRSPSGRVRKKYRGVATKSAWDLHFHTGQPLAARSAMICCR